MRVHWTDRAKARLRHIKVHIAEDSPRAAKEVVERILRRSWALGDPPEIGRQAVMTDDRELREVKIRPYRLLYRVRPELDQIDVITVLHYRQLLPQDLRRAN
jgi:toxin ParE1/3/4